MIINIFYTISFLIFCITTQAQISGNRNYERNNDTQRYATTPTPQPSIVLEKDSVLYINANVLMNTQASYYILVLGVNQTAKTSQQAMLTLNTRIQKCTTAIANTIKIDKADMYVDFISQTKTYDYEVKNSNNETMATQKQMGFQTKKNIIVKFKNLTDVDALITQAAEQEIYDIIKVDYVVPNPLQVHLQMLEEATTIINQKKAWYQKNTSLELLPVNAIQNDVFYGLYPAKMYQSYQAFESANVTNNNNYESRNSFVKKDMLMDKTFFYEGDDVAKYDKVINAGVPQVGVQFVLNCTMKYLVKKK